MGGETSGHRYLRQNQGEEGPLLHVSTHSVDVWWGQGGGKPFLLALLDWQYINLSNLCL